jgi:urease accessory protein
VLLTLLQLADSALPVGGGAHSYGLETLVAECGLTPANLAEFLHAHLEEGLALEAVFLRHAWRLGAAEFVETRWRELNRELSARRPAREPRLASLAVGRRFLALANSLEPRALFDTALQAEEIHHAIAFGLVCGVLGICEDWAALAYLQQTVTALVSACQRLMPLGQTAAARLIRNARPRLEHIAAAGARLGPDDAGAFSAALEVAGMRHPWLPVRLFIS